MLLCGERNQNYFWSYGFLGFNLKQKDNCQSSEWSLLSGGADSCGSGAVPTPESSKCSQRAGLAADLPRSAVPRLPAGWCLQRLHATCIISVLLNHRQYFETH